jgi:hypothetical protein
MTKITRRPLDQACSLIRANPSEPSRRRLESCVSRVFADAHGARITHFHDLLIGAANSRGELLGVIGASAGHGSKLFLESYTDVPIEQLISRHTGRPVARSQIVEVGNLAVEHPGAARLLVTRLAENLHDQGVRWVVLTGTTRVRHVLRRLGADLVDFGHAEGAAMGDALSNWGTYYDNKPRVVAVELAPFCAAFSAGEPLVARLQRLWRRVRRMALPARPVFSHA